jgi:hypothetical protein
MGDTRGIAASLHCLGLLALARGDYQAGATLLKQGLATHRETRNKLGIANCLEGLAGTALANDRPEQAARLLGVVEALLELVGGQLQWGARDRYERDRTEVRNRMDDGAFATARAEGRAMSLEQAIVFALNDG